MDIVCVVLGADTKKDRTKDSIELIEYAFSNYQMVDLGYMIEDEFDTLISKSKFYINKGITNDLKMELEENDISYYPVNKENVKDVKVEIELQNKLEAPICRGDNIRKIIYKNR